MKSHQHFQQELNYSCGAAAVRQVLSFFGIQKSESEIRKSVKTNCKGTHSCNSFGFLKATFPDKEISIIHPDIDWNNDSKWLNYISNSNVIYVSADFICGGNRRGRYSHSHHAFVIKNGIIYDPGQSRPYPIEAYGHTFDKELKIKTLILIHTGNLPVDIR